MPGTRAAAVVLTIGFGVFTARLPLGVARAVGRAVAWAAYYVIPRIRRAGLANLELAYGDALARAEKTRILKRSVRNLGIVAAECSRIPKLAEEDINAYVTFSGLEHIDKSKGGVIISAHLGNWEWIGPALATQGYRFAEVVRPFAHAGLDRFIDGLRRRGGIITIPKSNAMGEMLRLLGQGYLVGILVDQSPASDAVPVRFFGQSTWSTVGPAVAAGRAGVPIYVVLMPRTGDGRYRLIINPALEPAETGDIRKDVTENTQRCQSAIEQIVREYPEQWLWVHRRWKPRPHLEQNQAQRGLENPGAQQDTEDLQ